MLKVPLLPAQIAVVSLTVAMGSGFPVPMALPVPELETVMASDTLDIYLHIEHVVRSTLKATLLMPITTQIYSIVW